MTTDVNVSITGVLATGSAGAVTTSAFVAGVDPIIAVEADWLSDRATEAAQAGPTPEQVEAEFLACMLKVRSSATVDSKGVYRVRYRPTVPCLPALITRINAHDPTYIVTVASDPYVYGNGSIELTWRIDPA